MRLSIFSVVKNEEQMIEDMLKSAVGVDEHIIVDTGSTDSTIEICNRYPTTVFTDYTWQDHFAEAKNHALSKCTGDWIMGLDADCRLEPGGVEKIKAMCEAAPASVNVLNVRLVPNDLANKDTMYHKMPKVFRAGKGVHYVGRVHEVPNELGWGDGGVHIVYLYSPNHYTDPERNIRILLQEDQEKPRTLFYLGREHYERRRYKEAIEYFEKYLKKATWTPEIAEAYLTVSRCYWFSGNGDKARETCLQAIRCNPDFKEALRFMAAIHYEPWKSKWMKIADNATNKDVLFVRT